ncbi:hypothetical protein K6W78_15295 [Burkholderia cepacia]|uniref:hypothetical protein n=1 Tax=Burkholderia cepacia TaxID=292 RepID=UPI001C96ECA4|nr:hypothetical protein [Burkholderia cepacia]MBY4801363.1 hypothetical protein [Burkholderia cepacia]
MEVANGRQRVAALQTDRHSKSGSIPWRGRRKIMLRRIAPGHHVMTAGRRAASKRNDSRANVALRGKNIQSTRRIEGMKRRPPTLARHHERTR